MSAPDLRPLSPHLGIYKPQISSVLSISHRISGLALVAGMLLLVVWLWAAAYSARCFEGLHGFMASPVGLAAMLGWTLAFFYHFANGLRHLMWDTGSGLTVKEMHASGWAVIIFTIVMTCLTWWMALNVETWQAWL